MSDRPSNADSSRPDERCDSIPVESSARGVSNMPSPERRFHFRRGQDCERSETSPLGPRVLLNLALFVVLMLALWVGFYRHLQPLLAGLTIFGGTIGLWALVSVGYGWIKTMFRGEAHSFTVDLLKSPRVTEPLTFSCFVVIAVQVFTSSVYVEYIGGDPTFTVEVRNGDRAFLKPLEVGVDDTSAGRPFLGKFGSPVLTFRIQGMPDRGSLERTLRPWSSLRVRVPDDFPVRRVTVLRLLPGVSMMNCYLPDVDADVDAAADTAGNADERASRYELHVTVDGDTFVAGDVRKRPIYLGGAAQDLRWAHEQTDAQSLHAALDGHLGDLRVPEPARRRWLRHWKRAPAMLTAVEPKAGQEIRIELFRRVGDRLETEPVHSRTVEVRQEWIGKTTSVFLEVGPC